MKKMTSQLEFLNCHGPMIVIFLQQKTVKKKFYKKIYKKKDATPNVLWIWQISSLSLHTIIIQINPIKSFNWSPTDHMLLISTDNSKLYSFTLSKIYVFDIEVDKKVNLKFNKLYWSNDGKYFIMEDKSNFIIGSPIIDNDNDNNNNNRDEEYNNDIYNMRNNQIETGNRDGENFTEENYNENENYNGDGDDETYYERNNNLNNDNDNDGEDN